MRKLSGSLQTAGYLKTAKTAFSGSLPSGLKAHVQNISSRQAAHSGRHPLHIAKSAWQYQTDDKRLPESQIKQSAA